MIHKMNLELMPVIYNGKMYKIEEDHPNVGAYLYVFENDKCLADYLQDTIKDCIEFAFEEFDVPKDIWQPETQSQPIYLPTNY